MNNQQESNQVMSAAEVNRLTHQILEVLPNLERDSRRTAVQFFKSRPASPFLFFRPKSQGACNFLPLAGF